MLFKLPHTLPLKHGALKLAKALAGLCGAGLTQIGGFGPYST